MGLAYIYILANTLERLNLISLDASTPRVNPEHVFLDGGQMEHQQITNTTMKKIHRPGPPDGPVVETHGTFEILSKVEDEAMGVTEPSVRPCH